jgi:hypothetical protein
MQRITDGMVFEPHAETHHQLPGGDVVGEAWGNHATHLKLLETDAEQLGGRLRGVPLASVIGSDHPAQLGQGSLHLVLHLVLGPRVSHGQHQIADHLTVALHDEGLGEPFRVEVLLGVRVAVCRQTR